MNKLQKARWNNILKKAGKVNRLIKKGYIVFNHFNQVVNNKFKFCKKEKYLYQSGENCRVVYVGQEGSGWTSTLCTPIKEYNAKSFDKWTAVHPKNIKKI